jgi:hypothetical protein
VADGAAAAQIDFVAIGLAASGSFASVVPIAAPVGSIAALIAPVALITVLRDTSVMIRFPVYVVDIDLFLRVDRTSAT